jgi:hypothetical protein
VTDEISELLKRVLVLPPAARAALAGSLLESLDEAADKGAEGSGRRRLLAACRNWILAQ